MEEMCLSVPPAGITDNVTAAPTVEEVKACFCQLKTGPLVYRKEGHLGQLT